MIKKEWISIFIQQSESVMTLWNVYIVVVAAIIGFVIQRGVEFKPKERNIFVFSFVLFSMSNGYPLYRAQDTLAIIFEKLPSESQDIFSVTCPELVLTVYFIFSVIVLSFLFFAPFVNNDKDI